MTRYSHYALSLAKEYLMAIGNGADVYLIATRSRVIYRKVAP